MIQWHPTGSTLSCFSPSPSALPTHHFCGSCQGCVAPLENFFQRQCLANPQASTIFFPRGRRLRRAKNFIQSSRSQVCKEVINTNTINFAPLFEGGAPQGAGGVISMLLQVLSAFCMAIIIFKLFLYFDSDKKE